MLKAYSLDARIASIGAQLIDRVHQVAKNLENLPVYKNPHNSPPPHCRSGTETKLNQKNLGRYLRLAT